jgi:xanthine/CO dehydrogenase XdhC/CoxF family maturation factor
MTEMAAILKALAGRRDSPAALATLVNVEGSSYRRPGARLLLLRDGTRIGSISGGCLEEDVLERAQRVLVTGRPETAVYDTTLENDLVWGVGLGCQGVVRIFIEQLPADNPRWVGTLATNLSNRRDTALIVDFGGAAPAGTQLAAGSRAAARGTMVFRETISAPPALVVFGAGDDAGPLVRIARTLGWHLTVADARKAYANATRFPDADDVVSAPLAELVDRVPLDERSFAVIMTHRYADDLQLLRTLLPRPLAYLGLLGPRKRTDRLLAQLEAGGFVPQPEMLERLHAPVGLDLGGNTPETVALAIIAEMQARFAGRIPGFLRERSGPIHA